ncbi:MAG TPA: hypothetical protein VFN13_05830 [Rudaea sp.]|nr:hypothetical protein [Rudaea sp.]
MDVAISANGAGAMNLPACLAARNFQRRDSNAFSRVRAAGNGMRTTMMPVKHLAIAAAALVGHHAW